MKKICIFIMFMFLLGGVQAAITFDADTLKDNYNSNIDKVPGFAKSLLGSERINVLIELENGSQLKFGAVTKKAIIEQLSSGEIENATLKVHTSEKTINDIADADKPVAKLQECLSNGQISYEATKASTRAKLGISSFFMRIALFFQRMFSR